MLKVAMDAKGNPYLGARSCRGEGGPAQKGDAGAPADAGGERVLLDLPDGTPIAPFEED
jgi:hypothetical protein